MAHLEASDVVEELKTIADDSSLELEHNGIGVNVKTKNGFKVVVLGDLGYMDVVQEAEAPDGRTANFGDWHQKGQGNPANLLSRASFTAISLKLGFKQDQ